ncbi:MAG: molybdopterin-dependent oxidoreductase [Chloroflexi bacterium]|nr:molybdopterin-dependent oxidoreductase [Chloroflexota bacterium]
MALSRRKFLVLAGGSALGAVIFEACGVPSRELLVESPIEMPEDAVTGLDNWYATLCRQCSTSEGVIVRVIEGRAKKVEGNPDYPINLGKHSACCEAGLQALYHPDRLRGPMRRVGERGSGEFQEISWEEALDELVAELKKYRGSDADTVVLATDPLRGHLGMVAKRFADAYGARAMALEPVEQSVLRGAVKVVYGQEQLPDFDIENANHILSFGADFLSTWLSPVRFAVKYGQFRGKRPRGTFVQIESRFSATAANADEWVFIKPGYEGILALSIAQVIISERLWDAKAPPAMTGGAWAQSVQSYSPENVAKDVGIAPERIRELAREFARRKPSLALGGDLPAAHTNGSSNLSAIYALNYLVGSVGNKGGIIFNPEPPLPELPIGGGETYKQWHDMADRLRSGRPKPVNLLLVRGINPVHSLANLDFKDALNQVGKVVSFSSFMDDTTAMADLVLPEHVYLEDWGDDLPNPGPGYRLVGIQQPIVRPLYNTRSFGDILLTLAQELGMERQLPWGSFKEVLEDGAEKLFDMGKGSVKAPGFKAFWSGVLQRGGWWDVEAKSTAVAPVSPQLPEKVEKPSFAGSDGEYPFHLLPFQHPTLTDGRGAHLPWLQATPDPLTSTVWHTWIEINTVKAEEMGIKEGDVIAVESPHGTIEALAYPSRAVSPEVVCIPIGQGHTYFGRYAERRGSNVFAILAPEKNDKETGALAWAATKVRLTKTGRWARLSKFEGEGSPGIQTEERDVVQITRTES